MGFVDILLMILIVGGAVYMLYRSIWKKKGHCSGCNDMTCTVKKGNGRVKTDKDGREINLTVL